jgi:hypothetical protein
LVDLGLLTRETPFGASSRESKRSLYRLADPFLRTWYRFVEPNRSRLETGKLDAVWTDVSAAWPQHVGEAWEDLCRRSVSRMKIAGASWGGVARWWGRGPGAEPIELDLVAACDDDPGRVLVGEVKRACSTRDVPRLLADLRRRAALVPDLKDRRIEVSLWLLKPSPGLGARVDGGTIIDAARVLRALR